MLTSRNLEQRLPLSVTQRSPPSCLPQGCIVLLALTASLTLGIHVGFAQKPTSADSSATTRSTSPTATQALSPDERTRIELLESYQFLREQLRAAQVAIASNRIEAQEVARRQSEDLNARLDALRASLSVVNQRQQEAAARAEYDRYHQEQAANRSYWTLLWISGIAGAAILLTLLVMTRMQWRAMNRIADTIGLQPQLLAHSSHYLQDSRQLPQQGDTTVIQANNRLATAVDRIERRVSELESAARSPEHRV